MKNMRKSYLDKTLTRSLLVDEYVLKKKPATKIATELKVSDDSVYRYLKKYKIKVRPFNLTQRINSFPYQILTKKFLEEEYVKKKKVMQQIEEDTGINYKTIGKYLKYYGIKVRNKSEANKLSNRIGKRTLTPLFLKRRYIDEKKSTTDIGNEIGCDNKTVSRWLKRAGIKIRVNAEAVSLAGLNGRTFDLSKVRDLIDGLLLGDGSIQPHSSFSSVYTQVCKHKTWLDAIGNEFKKNHIKYSIKQYPSNRWKLYTLRTLNYTEFSKLEKEWYQNRKKVVPSNIKLTPRCVAMWYLGDGWLAHTKYSTYASIDSTIFKITEMNFLSKKINQLMGIHTTTRKYIYKSIFKDGIHKIYKSNSKYRIRLYIPVIDTPKFLKIIEKFKVPCYAYKWRI